MAEVFISYAREDSEAVERLVGALAEAGVDCWWDRQMSAGTRFADAIEANLRAAKAVVVIWTRHSVASNWVADEAWAGTPSAWCRSPSMARRRRLASVNTT